jgi:hypothetical protein
MAQGTRDVHVRRSIHCGRGSGPPASVAHASIAASPCSALDRLRSRGRRRERPAALASLPAAPRRHYLRRSPAAVTRQHLGRNHLRAHGGESVHNRRCPVRTVGSSFTRRAKWAPSSRGAVHRAAGDRAADGDDADCGASPRRHAGARHQLLTFAPGERLMVPPTHALGSRSEQQYGPGRDSETRSGCWASCRHGGRSSALTVVTRYGLIRP